ncbi:dihydrofolate reductase family protein [Coccidioides posadasii C735 delta SOWgp]|uniref:Dihydrofolate reductase n=3 Tax=Coccidioides posadasii TaxID=199306 RepID=E9DD57_COCPS|nr:dihydrofolate reductase family protein [Coccidioides posadasii C735 delta SOWgp]EER24130.1 dihydrofolate reductase family protein [Coccidioides posadasii C735 delta SOWgp]EFW15582.1 conserved hypothetical protein [Coccidioides posadasii str. Silveira]|eukprot:XP_003066275.1 dihydrofolate reductase family protein [Coccidioides posadasii C735 delta SOWgp]
MEAIIAGFTMSPHCPSAFANSAKLPPLTLVVATTPVTSHTNPSISRLGIGNCGTLPWPRIKSDMSFFARITTRPPAAAQPQLHTPNALNAVIMGRKTYDSLPSRFRPLPKRLNVIITRDESGMVCERAAAEWKAARKREWEKAQEKKDEFRTESKSCSSTEKNDSIEELEKETPDVLVSNGIGSALLALRDSFNPFSQNGRRSLGNVLVIGGAEIYASSLKLDPTGLGCKMRIVMTDVRRPTSEAEKNDPSRSSNGFECDTFFPIDNLDGNDEWRRASAGEVSEWVGEAVPEGWVWDQDIALRFLGYERR